MFNQLEQFFFFHRVSQFEAQFVDEFHIIKTVMSLLVLDENNNNYSIDQEVFVSISVAI